MSDEPLGVACGQCGGQVYMETCRMSNPTDHDWVVASECQQCGARSEIVCPECPLTEEQVYNLPTGALVRIEWAGGNRGEYYIERHGDFIHWRSPHLMGGQWQQAMRSQDPLGFIGSERFHNRVFLIERPQ